VEERAVNVGWVPFNQSSGVIDGWSDRLGQW
jgi:hypothetical protein